MVDASELGELKKRCPQTWIGLIHFVKKRNDWLLAINHLLIELRKQKINEQLLLRGGHDVWITAHIYSFKNRKVDINFLVIRLFDFILGDFRFTSASPSEDGNIAAHPDGGANVF